MCCDLEHEAGAFFVRARPQPRRRSAVLLQPQCITQTHWAPCRRLSQAALGFIIPPLLKRI